MATAHSLDGSVRRVRAGRRLESGKKLRMLIWKLETVSAKSLDPVTSQGKLEVHIRRCMMNELFVPFVPARQRGVVGRRRSTRVALAGLPAPANRWERLARPLPTALPRDRNLSVAACMPRNSMPGGEAQSG